MALVRIEIQGRIASLILERDIINALNLELVTELADAIHRIEDDDAGLVNLTSEIPLLDSVFHHLAVTQDGFGVRIYIDGVEVRSSGDNSGSWTDHLALTGLWLGRGHWAWFNGAIDELGLHARALRPEEIAERALR